MINLQKPSNTPRPSGNNIGIIGAGNLGANIAFFLAEQQIAVRIKLYDALEGYATGKTLDIQETAPIRNYRAHLIRTNSLAEAWDTDIVVLALGTPRKVGAAREDMWEPNIASLEEVTAAMPKYRGIVIVMTEPVDAFTAEVARRLPDAHVMGVGTLLDAIRLRTLIGLKIGVAVDDVTALVIGTHNSHALYLPDTITISGAPATALLPKSGIDELIEESRAMGDRLLEGLSRSSAWYTAAAAAADLIGAIICDSGKLLPVSMMANGIYGLDDVAISLPAVLNAHGASRIYELSLEPHDLDMLRTAAAHQRQIRERGGARA